MMPTIEISEAAFSYLKSLAEPFVDQPRDVLDRIVSEHIALMSSTDMEGGLSAEPTKTPRALPDASYTALEGAWVAGQPIPKKDWQRLLVETIAACTRKSDRSAVKGHLFLTHWDGDRSGYSQYYVPDADLTMQGASAGRILKQIERLARAFEVPVRIVIRWADNPKAAKPGQVEELALP